MIPNLRHLRAFEAVFRHNSINLAAQAVSLTQPAVTQAMKRLEKHFDASLLTRRANGTYATDAGTALEARVTRFFRQSVTAISQGMGAAGGRNPEVAAAVLNRLTYPQMRAFIAVAEAGSFSVAARRLQIAEPSLNRSARDLEKIVGRRLFVRSSLGVSANRVGQELARRLRVALRELDLAAEEIDALKGQVAGRVAVASLPLSRTLILPRAINSLLKQHPEAKVEVIDGPYETVLNDLRHGTVDFLLGALRQPPPATDVVEEPLFSDPYAIIARAGHPLLNAPQVTREMLSQYDWVIPRAGTPVRRAFDMLFADTPCRPRANIETSSLVATRGILAESDRLTLLSLRQIVIDERLNLLKVVPFPLPETSRSIGVTTRADWQPGPVQKAFLTFLKASCRQESQVVA